ncbi:MAG: cell division protein FtsQ [Bacteroidota bacterium]
MWSKIKLTKTARIAAAFVVMLSLIAFVGRDQDAELCTDIIIRIENQANNYFLDKEDVQRLLTNNGSEMIVGRRYSELDLKVLEQRLKEEKFVKQSQVYKDLKGNVMAKITLRRPVARIVQSGKEGAYIAEDGTLLPTSYKFSSRVVLLSGSYFKKVLAEEDLNAKEANDVLDLVAFIQNDEFWSAQIAQIDIDTKGNVMLYPQVTKQYVKFGKIDEVEDKFTRLKVFYKQVLPRKGWNYYDGIDLRFKDQAIGIKS